MPKLVYRNPESAPGDRYIDTHCIDCAASREIAPGLVIRPHGKSVQQPKPSGRMVIPAGLPEAELKITEILPVRFSALEGANPAGPAIPDPMCSHAHAQRIDRNVRSILKGRLRYG